MSAGARGASPAGALSVARAALERPERAALVTDERTLSFSTLAALASRAGEVLRRVEPSRVVAFVASLEVETLAFALAALEQGRVLLPLHPRLTPSEREELVLLAHAVELAPGVESSGAMEPAPGGSPEAPAPDLVGLPRRDALLLATSGTSGRPKLCVLSHEALIASAEASAQNLGVHERDRWLLCMPFAHAGGFSVLTRCLGMRRSVVMVPRFDPDRVLDAVVRHDVTLLSVVPTMLSALLERDRNDALSRLRAILVGGAPFPLALRRAARERGLAALASYGLTEMASQVTTQRPGRDEPDDALDSGQALAGVELRIGGVAGASPDTLGEIGVRGPMRMSGYVGARPLDDAEVFETRDVGFLDAQGRLCVVGRADDVIVTGGENVHPFEVERRLLEQPGVRAALVLGVPDERFGEQVAAVLVLDPGLELDAVVAAASAQLAPFKRPRRLLSVDALPTNAVGKPDRRAARARLLARDVG